MRFEPEIYECLLKQVGTPLVKSIVFTDVVVNA